MATKFEKVSKKVPLPPPPSLNGPAISGGTFFCGFPSIKDNFFVERSNYNLT